MALNPVQPTQASSYEEMIITPLVGDNDPVDLKGGVTQFQYFEDLFSPILTARMEVVNTGAQLKYNSVYNGLPIRGGEKVEIKIRTPWEMAQGSGEEPMMTITMYVNSITNYVQTHQFESFILELVSREAIVNMRKRIVKKYKGKRIDELMKVILDSVEAEYEEEDIEKTQNTYNFIGNLRKPFTIAPMLASRGIPEGANSFDAGYFLWQTRKGHHFKSIKSIIEKKDDHYKYKYYFRMTQGGAEQANWTQIIDYAIDSTQNITGSSSFGEYATYRIYFNPNTFEFTEPHRSVFEPNGPGSVSVGFPNGQATVTDNRPARLGISTESIESADHEANPAKSDITEFAQRIVSGVYNVGCLDKEVNKGVNMDQLEDISQSISRYNSIFTQVLNMTIPCNPELCAGDVIECNFPRIAVSPTDVDQDTEQSGLYIIKEITHFFSPTKSYTAMKLTRDTSGVA